MENSFDILRLPSFINELNVARRLISAYPPNHPIIKTSTDKFLKLLAELLGGNSGITIGAAKETLVVLDTPLEKNNPSYVNLARLLFGHGIAAITFSKNLSTDELISLLSILILKHEQIDEKGGIVKLLEDAEISSVKVQLIDYRAFRAADEDHLHDSDHTTSERNSGVIWEEFVIGLMEGKLLLEELGDELSPTMFAEVMNRKGVDGVKIANSIAGFFNQLGGGSCKGELKEELVLRLSAFINRLSPEMRKQFVGNVLTSLSDREELAESILPHIPEETILDLLDDMNIQEGGLSQNILGIIGRLSTPLGNKVTALERQRLEMMNDGMMDKLRKIFQEEKPTGFMSEGYSKTLHSIIAAEMISTDDKVNLDGMKLSMESHAIEEKISSIILEIVDSDIFDCDPEIMERNLIDLCGYFLGLGDFASLVNIYDRIKQRSESPDRLQKYVLEVFSKPEFIEEVLSGLNNWGKAKYVEISELVARVEGPFIDPLLERLAEEQSMSLRRFYMERLQDIGAAARDAVLVRLHDHRWYFIRNLLIFLRNLSDPVALPHIRRLTGHPHQKVQQEAVRALLHFGDAEAYRQLLRQMSGADHEQVLNAVRLAEHSNNPEITKLLLSFIQRRGLTGFNFELKITTIRTLGKIGDPNFIKEIEYLLLSSSILFSGRLNTIKNEAIQSLKHYPRHSVVPLMKNFAESNKKSVRQISVEIYRIMQEAEDGG